MPPKSLAAMEAPQNMIQSQPGSLSSLLLPHSTVQNLAENVSCGVLTTPQLLDAVCGALPPLPPDMAHAVFAAAPPLRYSRCRSPGGVTNILLPPPTMRRPLHDGWFKLPILTLEETYDFSTGAVQCNYTVNVLTSSVLHRQFGFDGEDDAEDFVPPGEGDSGFNYDEFYESMKHISEAYSKTQSIGENEQKSQTVPVAVGLYLETYSVGHVGDLDGGDAVLGDVDVAWDGHWALRIQLNAPFTVRQRFDKKLLHFESGWHPLLRLYGTVDKNQGEKCLAQHAVVSWFLEVGAVPPQCCHVGDTSHEKKTPGENEGEVDTTNLIVNTMLSFRTSSSVSKSNLFSSWPHTLVLVGGPVEDSLQWVTDLLHSSSSGSSKSRFRSKRVVFDWSWLFRNSGGGHGSGSRSGPCKFIFGAEELSSLSDDKLQRALSNMLSHAECVEEFSGIEYLQQVALQHGVVQRGRHGRNVFCLSQRNCINKLHFDLGFGFSHNASLTVLDLRQCHGAVLERYVTLGSFCPSLREVFLPSSASSSQLVPLRHLPTAFCVCPQLTSLDFTVLRDTLETIGNGTLSLMSVSEADATATIPYELAVGWSWESPTLEVNLGSVAPGVGGSATIMSALTQIGGQFCCSRNIVRLDISGCTQLRYIGENFARSCRSLETLILGDLLELRAIGHSFARTIQSLSEVRFGYMPQLHTIGRGFLAETGFISQPASSSSAAPHDCTYVPLNLSGLTHPSLRILPSFLQGIKTINYDEVIEETSMDTSSVVVVVVVWRKYSDSSQLLEAWADPEMNHGRLLVILPAHVLQALIINKGGDTKDDSRTSKVPFSTLLNLVSFSMRYDMPNCTMPRAGKASGPNTAEEVCPALVAFQRQLVDHIVEPTEEFLFDDGGRKALVFCDTMIGESPMSQQDGKLLDEVLDALLGCVSGAVLLECVTSDVEKEVQQYHHSTRRSPVEKRGDESLGDFSNCSSVADRLHVVIDIILAILHDKDLFHCIPHVFNEMVNAAEATQHDGTGNLDVGTVMRTKTLAKRIIVRGDDDDDDDIAQEGVDKKKNLQPYPLIGEPDFSFFLPLARHQFSTTMYVGASVMSFSGQQFQARMIALLLSRMRAISGSVTSFHFPTNSCNNSDRRKQFSTSSSQQQDQHLEQTLHHLHDWETPLRQLLFDMSYVMELQGAFSRVPKQRRQQYERRFARLFATRPGMPHSPAFMNRDTKFRMVICCVRDSPEAMKALPAYLQGELSRLGDVHKFLEDLLLVVGDDQGSKKTKSKSPGRQDWWNMNTPFPVGAPLPTPWTPAPITTEEQRVLLYLFDGPFTYRPKRTRGLDRVGNNRQNEHGEEDYSEASEEEENETTAAMAAFTASVRNFERREMKDLQRKVPLFSSQQSLALYSLLDACLNMYGVVFRNSVLPQKGEDEGE